MRENKVLRFHPPWRTFFPPGLIPIAVLRHELAKEYVSVTTVVTLLDLMTTDPGKGLGFACLVKAPQMT